jgi:hypothetical protein
MAIPNPQPVMIVAYKFDGSEESARFLCREFDNVLLHLNDKGEWSGKIAVHFYQKTWEVDAGQWLGRIDLDDDLVIPVSAVQIPC